MFKKLFQNKRYTPQARWGHACISVGTKAIVWGGMQATTPEIHQSAQKTRQTSVIEVFDFQTAKWNQERTVGNPPLGIRGQAYATIGSDVYFFGGFCGHDWCRHNSVYCLDSLTNIWREIVPFNTSNRPMKKSRSGMFHYRCSQDQCDYLCIIGGTGLLCSANETNATYLPWRENPDWGWTDEHHLLDLANSQWIVPCITGEIAPPCAGFTLTKISDNSAIFYGGFQPSSGACLSDIYIVTVIDINRVHWKKLNTVPEPGRSNDRSFPIGRQDHTMICLSSKLTGHNRTILLMSGGRDHKGNTLNDTWLLDIDRNMWTQVFLLESVAQRHFHTSISIVLTNETLLVLLFGGVREWLWGKPARQQPALTATVLLEATATPDGDWRLRVLMGETDNIPIDDYQHIIHQVTAVKENEQMDEENDQILTSSPPPLPQISGSQDELDTSVSDTLRPTSPTHNRSSQVKLSTPTGVVIYDIPITPSHISPPPLPLSPPPSQPTATRSDPTLLQQPDSMIPAINNTTAINTIKELQKQVIIAQGRANDIEEVLHKAVMAAENRAVKAEEKCRLAEGRSLVLEGQVKTLGELVKKSEEELIQTKNDLLRYSEQTVHLEQQLLESESRAITSEIAVNEMEIQYENQKIKLKRQEEKERENDETMKVLVQQITNIKEEMSQKLLNNSTLQLDNNEGITLLLKDSTFNGTFSQLQITHCETSHEYITLQELLAQDNMVAMSQGDIACIAKDIALTIVYLHRHQIRQLFNLSLNDPSTILVCKKEGQYSVQLIVSTLLANNISTTRQEEKDISFQNDLKNFAKLLLTMATPFHKEEENIKEQLASIQWPVLTDFIHKCINQEEHNDITVDTLVTYIYDAISH